MLKYYQKFTGKLVRRVKLTFGGFLKFYPDAERNTAHLTDWGCSVCGNRTRFAVTVTTQFEMVDQGMDAQCGDHEFDDDSPARCYQCGAEGTTADFDIKGLDRAIARRIKLS